MTDMWEQTDEMAKRHQGNGSYLKLANDGEAAVVVFVGQPQPKEVCYTEGKYVAFDDKCKAQGLSPTLRVAYRVALLDSKDVKTFEQGITFFKDVKQLRAKYGLESWAFEIKRCGAAKDPNTTYKVLPERQLTPEEQRMFAALRKAEEQNPPALPPVDDSDPMQAILRKLKGLPRESVERFCSHFRLKRVRDLPPAQLDDATRFVNALMNASAPPQEDEIDPFAE